MKLQNGEFIGEVLVLSFDKKCKHRNYYLCKCPCGNIFSCRADRIANRVTKSCGCLLKKFWRRRTPDLSGQIFGRLTVIKENIPLFKEKTVMWECLCKCGGVKIVKTSNLKNGSVKSCGCLRKESWHRSGTESNSFKKTKSEEERAAATERAWSPELKKWRKSVFERDAYTCQISGKTGISLCAHHLEAWASNKELRFVLENGITLSATIHTLFHKIYGRKGYNTRGEFNEFKTRYNSGEFSNTTSIL